MVKKSRNTELDISNIKQRFIWLIVVMSLATIFAASAALWFLYQTAVEGQRERLVNIVQSRARIIESVARYDLQTAPRLGMSIEQSHAATISQVKEAHDQFSGFGQTGEFTFAKKRYSEIVFILQQRHSETTKPKNIPWQSPHAEPMRRALSGQAGTLVGLDYRGVKVLAAHEPVALLDAGIVAKIDLEEIQGPYIQSAAIVLGITTSILVLGVLLFITLTYPILKVVTEGYARLKAIIDYSPNLIILFDKNKRATLSSPAAKALSGQIPVEGESIVKHHDGTAHTYLSSTFPLSYGHQQFGWCQISTDITEKVAAEKELKQLAMAFQNTSDAVAITDANTKIVVVNSAFEKITGYTRNEVIGQNPRLFKSGLHDSNFYDSLWLHLQEKGHWSGEIWNRRKSGEAYAEWLNINAVYDSNQKATNYIAVFSDITKQKESQKKLHYLAYHDPLTNLPNRLLFHDRLEEGIRLAKRQQKKLALFILDVDRFKATNDTLGHAAGDVLLKKIASRLRKLVRESDTVARIGGDEFTIIVNNVADEHGVLTFAHKLVGNLDYHFDVAGRQLLTTISVGISIYPHDGLSSEALLKNSDLALYKAKESGRNNFKFFKQELGDRIIEKMEIQSQINKGLERREFRLVYQPQFDIATEKLNSAECLVRWEHPEHGLIAPYKFIPIAEESGQIIALGNWILEEACHQAAAWLKQGFHFNYLSVNISSKQINNQLVDTLEKVLAKSTLPASKLQLEITESYVMSKIEESIPILEQLKALGVSIAIDDFGTGYSSLAYLKKLPVDTLKIDRSFIKELPEHADDVAICRAIIALGTNLGMKIVAEGVEETSQWQFLNSEKCDLAQGYLKGKPVSAEVFSNTFFTRNSGNKDRNLMAG